MDSLVLVFMHWEIVAYKKVWDMNSVSNVWLWNVNKQ